MMATTPRFGRSMSCASAFWITAGMAIALLVAGPVAPASAIELREGFNASVLAANDDGSTSLVDIGFSVNFYGKTVSKPSSQQRNGTFTRPGLSLPSADQPGNPPISPPSRRCYTRAGQRPTRRRRLGGWAGRFRRAWDGSATRAKPTS